MTKLLKNIYAVLIGSLIALLIGEITLRIYNPFPFRVKGNKIILPSNQKYIISNPTNSKLDTLLIHTKNNLGFRGKEKPNNFDNFISLIAVGGSTTECYYLSDGKDWPILLENKLTKNFDNIWVNNAGLDGHSTFGHYILLTDYLIDIKPDIILYLVGCNDVGREDLGKFDKYTLQGEYFSFKNWFIENSELIGLIVNISRVFRARRISLAHRETILTELEHTQIDMEVINKELLKHQPYVSLYKDRLIQLVKKTKENSIQPILITQPTILGKGIDNETGINLETVKLMSEYGGKSYWMILEQYNEVTRQVAKQENIIIIDLASKLPKDSKYFYDVLHFTNEGAEKSSEIIAEELGKYPMSNIQGN